MDNQDNPADLALWDEFLKSWPIERLKTMQLSEYTAVGNIHTFTYWIEAKLASLGSIWGGSAFKFGIFSRKAKTSKENGGGANYTDDYGWYTKYGDSPDKAFRTIRDLIIQVAEAASTSNLDVIDHIDLGQAYKWKIAFHYQNRNSPRILNIFMKLPLAYQLGISDVKKIQMSNLYDSVLANKPVNLGLMTFSHGLFQEWLKKEAGNHLDIKLTQGAITNGYLNFNKNDSIFPNESIGDSSGQVLGKIITLLLENGDSKPTDIRGGSGNGLRIRARFNAYFKSIGAEAGDIIRILKINDSEYEVEHNPSDVADEVQNTDSTKVVNAMKEESMKQPLNTILYGPPGTGKTYSTTNKALQILNIPSSGRSMAKDIFNKRMKDGQILFTTFHQSMTYEDFIEGIKPIEPEQEGQSVNYKIVDGIFKKACAIAAYKCYQLFENSKSTISPYTFDNLYDAFINSIQEQIDSSNPPIFKTIRGLDTEVKEINKNNSILARAKNSKAAHVAPLTKENMQKLYDTFKNIEDIKSLQQVKDAVQIITRISEFYAVFSGLKSFEKSFKPNDELVAETKDAIQFDTDEIQKKFNARVFDESIKSYGDKAEPVVIIIDEINRGNVSQIFGELITLIEEDKRLGSSLEALEVILPYSKKPFGVPPNLYIIGTMNTADRSVEALDAALRRRFNFEEMQPNSSLIATEGILKDQQAVLEGISLPALLDTINLRIEKLIDKDHQIGHSYFMSVSSIDNLKMAFKNKIIPLLQEYFFGDYGKIGLVLGSGFIEKTPSSDSNIFADFDESYASEFSERVIYKVKNITDMEEDDFLSAVKVLMK